MLLMEVGSNDGSVNLFPQFPQNMVSSGALVPQYLQNSMSALLRCDRLQAIHLKLLDSIETEVAVNEITSGIECDTYSSLFVCRITSRTDLIAIHIKRKVTAVHGHIYCHRCMRITDCSASGDLSRLASGIVIDI